MRGRLTPQGSLPQPTLLAIETLVFFFQCSSYISLNHMLCNYSDVELGAFEPYLHGGLDLPLSRHVILYFPRISVSRRQSGMNEIAPKLRSGSRLT